LNTRKILIPSAIFVTLVAFVYLYLGLYELAKGYIHLAPLPAILFPFAVDAATLVFLVAALDKRVKGMHYVFVWSTVAALSAVSVVAQYIAHPATEATPLAPWLAAVPAASLIVLTHLLWIVAQDTITLTTEAEVLSKVTGDAQPGMLEKAIEAIEIAQQSGIKMTSGNMARVLGLTKENGSPHYSKGQQWLKKAEEAMA
jgi:hypothetical protein